MSSTRRGTAARRTVAALRRLARPARVQGSEIPLTEDRIAAIAEDAGAPVDEMLREVADFRLALETDMLIAAAALDEGEASIASEVLDGERAELADFQERVLGRLADAAAHDELAARRARRRTTAGLPRAVAAAAAVFALVAGSAVVRTAVAEPPTGEVALAQADRELGQLSRATLGDDTRLATDAATQLHETIQRLINEHGSDPKVARQIAQLLTNDLALIKSQPQLRAALAEAIQLARQLSRQAPANVRRTVAPLIDAAVASTKPSPSKSPSPKPSKKPSPKPSPSKSPSSSPSSGAEEEGDGSDPLPGTPGDNGGGLPPV